MIILYSVNVQNKNTKRTKIRDLKESGCVYKKPSQPEIYNLIMSKHY